MRRRLSTPNLFLNLSHPLRNPPSQELIQRTRPILIDCDWEEDPSSPAPKVRMKESLNSHASLVPTKAATETGDFDPSGGDLNQIGMAKPVLGQAKNPNSVSNPPSTKKAKPKSNRGGSKRQ
ncbi:hypothetical protein NL676_027329 [Syzygium grande]|nr:hypothetical protein NL676_027329 [Syzygium grande]